MAEIDVHHERDYARRKARQEVLYPPVHHDEPEGVGIFVHRMHRLGKVAVRIGPPVALGDRLDRCPHVRVQVGADTETGMPFY